MRSLQPNLPAAEARQHCHNSRGESNANRTQLPRVPLGSLWVSALWYLLELFEKMMALKMKSWNMCSALLTGFFTLYSSAAALNNICDATHEPAQGSTFYSSNGLSVFILQLDPLINKLSKYLQLFFGVFGKPTNCHIIIYIFFHFFHNVSVISSATSIIQVGPRHKAKDICQTPPEEVQQEAKNLCDWPNSCKPKHVWKNTQTISTSYMCNRCHGCHIGYQLQISDTYQIANGLLSSLYIIDWGFLFTSHRHLHAIMSAYLKERISPQSSCHTRPQTIGTAAVLLL